MPLFRRATQAACLAAALGGIAIAAAAQGLPDRLADSTFWRMSDEFSEPNGTFRSENLLSNETNFQYVIPELLKTIKPGGVYLGVAPEQNFTYIVALKPAMVFICDIRRGNLLEHLMYKSLMEMSDTRADFVARLFSRRRPAGLDTASSAEAIFAAFDSISPDTALYRHNFDAIRDHLIKDHGFDLSQADILQLAQIYDAFYEAGPELTYNFPNNNGFGGGRGGMPNYYQLMVATDGTGLDRSYLANEANYRWLRDFERRNLLVPVVGNFGGPKALRAIGSYVRAHDATITTFYLSNVEQYLFQDGIAGQFYENVATFPLDSTSTFIRSIGGARGGGFNGGGVRLGSVISSMQDMIKAYKDGRIQTWQDVGAMSHER